MPSTNTTQVAPQTTATLYLQPSGVYTAASTGDPNEQPTIVPVTDGVCLDDVVPNGNETTSDYQAYAQDVYHAILQTLGSNLDNPTVGFGAETWSSGSEADLRAAAGQLDRMLELDPRTERSSTKVLGSAPNLQMVVQVVPIGDVLPLQFSWNRIQGLQFVGSQ
jgi:hypothetical protein